MRWICPACGAALVFLMFSPGYGDLDCTACDWHREGLTYNPDAAALGQRGGWRGGHARAAALTDDQRRESARAAAVARWNRRKERPDVPAE